MAVCGAFFSHPAALYAQQGGEPAAKTQWQQKENYLKKKKKERKTKEKNPVKAARWIACMGEKYCSEFTEEQSLYKSKQH